MRNYTTDIMHHGGFNINSNIYYNYICKNKKYENI